MTIEMIAIMNIQVLSYIFSTFGIPEDILNLKKKKTSSNSKKPKKEIRDLISENSKFNFVLTRKHLILIFNEVCLPGVFICPIGYLDSHHYPFI